VALNQVPAGQLLQAPAPETLNRPAGHTTTVALEDPAGQAYPAVHLAVHAAARAVSLLHIPAPQALHAGEPARLNCPGWQASAVAVTDPGGHAYPAAHAALQALARAVPLLHVPAAHAVHAGAPAKLYRPGGQASAVALVDPAGQAYPPAQGALHALTRAVPPLQVPAGQSLHAPAPAALNRPAAHTTAVALAEPAGHACPAEQAPLQAPARAVTLLQVPGAQSVHEPARAKLYRPAGQGTTVELGEPAGHAYPAEQGSVHALVRAVASLHVPAAQPLHAPAPARLYCPAGQADAVALTDPAGHAYPAVHGPLQVGSVSSTLPPQLPGAH
jgi:hypothetical protein